MVRIGRRNHRRVQAAADSALKDAAALGCAAANSATCARSSSTMAGWPQNRRGSRLARSCGGQFKRLRGRSSSSDFQMLGAGALVASRAAAGLARTRTWCCAWRPSILSARARRSSDGEPRASARHHRHHRLRCRVSCRRVSPLPPHTGTVRSRNLSNYTCVSGEEVRRQPQPPSPSREPPPPMYDYSARELPPPSLSPSPPLSCELPSRKPPPHTYGDSLRPLPTQRP